MTEAPQFLAHFAEVEGADQGVGKYPRAPRVRLPPPFRNDNGKILNVFLGLAGGVALIDSVPGAVRANHYHTEDWHYTYVLDGCLDYYHRPHGSTGPLERERFSVGEMFFSPPMVEHAMCFHEYSRILTVSKRVRDHVSHEADVRRVSLMRRSQSALIDFEPYQGISISEG